MLSDYGLGALGRLVIQCFTLVSHLCPTCLLLTCMSHDVPDVPQQHPAALDRQRQETTTKQRERETSCSKHPPAAPAQRREQEEGKSPTKDTKEQPKKGREGERTRKSKPGKTRSKTRCKRDPGPCSSKLPESRIGRLNHMKEKPTGKILRPLRQAEPATSGQNGAQACRDQNPAAAGSSRQQQAAAGSSRQNTATAGRTQQQHAEPSASGQN